MATSEGAYRLHTELARAGANPPHDFTARFDAAVERELGTVAAVEEWGQPLPSSPSARSVEADIEARHGRVRLAENVCVVPGDEIVGTILREVGLDPSAPAVKRALANSHRQVLDLLRMRVRAAYGKDNPLQDQSLVKRLLLAPAVRKEVEETLDRESNRVQESYSDWTPGDRFGNAGPYHQEAHATEQTQHGFALRVTVEAVVPITLEA